MSLPLYREQGNLLIHKKVSYPKVAYWFFTIISQEQGHEQGPSFSSTLTLAWDKGYLGPETKQAVQILYQTLSFY